jgi:hypothetical protein
MFLELFGGISTITSYGANPKNILGAIGFCSQRLDPKNILGPIGCELGATEQGHEPEKYSWT